MNSEPSYGLSIFRQHAEMLAASKIPPEHALARGYVSVDTKKRVRDLGVTPVGCSVPGLLVPLRRADGSVWGYQYRPDNPRQRDGKPVKYETPTGQRNGLDVPPGVGPLLADPAVPLWVTEGTKKADSAACASLACIALPGVWSWRGTNSHGGRTALGDWNDVALNGRRVILAFDSDVTRKRAVRAALDHLAAYLASKGAVVAFCWLPDDDGGKCGLDDYLAGHSVDELVRLVRPDPPPAAEPPPVSPVSPVPPVSPDTPEQVGDVLLDDLRAWFGTYLCADPADLNLLTVWTAHTWLIESAYTTPRLLFDSPVPESGKTTALEHLRRLCRDPVLMSVVSSEAMLVRLLDERMRTLLIDEVDRALDPKDRNTKPLLAVLNSGYKRGATRPVLIPTKDGWTTAEMPTYAPVAMAGNNPTLPDDTRTRTLRILLLPDRYGTAAESDWELIEPAAVELAARLARWSGQVADRVRTERPPTPAGVISRARERWSPLLRVAYAAGGRWPATIAALALADVADVAADREEGIMQTRPDLALLQHIHDVWPHGVEFVPTDDMLGWLIADHPDVWGEASAYGRRLTAQRLGRMLAGRYKIRSTRQDVSSGRRGYTRNAFTKAWHAMGIEQQQATPIPISGVSGQTGETGETGEPVKPTPQLWPDAAESGTTPATCSTCDAELVEGRCLDCAYSAWKASRA